MLRQGRWKLNHYVGFPPELYDLITDPEELIDLAKLPEHAKDLERLEAALKRILDPDQTDALAFADQAALIESHGGREKAIKLGAPAATPPPKTVL